MITIRTTIGLLALATLFSGCATDGPTADGASVRAAMAGQVIPPQPRTGPQGSDGVSAVAAYANYKQSYVVPLPQGDSPLVGSHK